MDAFFGILALLTMFVSFAIGRVEFLTPYQMDIATTKASLVALAGVFYALSVRYKAEKLEKRIKELERAVKYYDRIWR